MLAFACAFTMFAGAAFTDAADIKADTAVEMLSALGVIDGYADGSFKPEGTVTRAEMAKMIYVVRNQGNDNADSWVSGTTKFTDVNGHWAAGYIKFCEAQKIIAGKSATIFDPNGLVTGTEAAKMLLVCGGYQADKAGLTGAGWDQKTLALASEAGLLDDMGATNFAAGLPRQYAAQIIYNALDMDTVTWNADANEFVKKETTTLEQRDTANGGSQWVNVTTNENLGMKWMKLETRTTKLTSVEKEDGKDTFILNGTFTKVANDYSNLIGQKVKVMIKDNDTSKVYGVYADDDSKVLATGIVGQLENVSGKEKTKLNGTEYKLEKITTSSTYEVKSDVKTVLIPNDSTEPMLSTLEGVKTAALVAGTIKLVDNNGNGKADVVVYTPVKTAKITYVGAKSITMNNGVGSKDIDDLDIYDGFKKDDWITYTDGDYTSSGDAKVEKAEMITAKVTSIKGTAGTDAEARVDGTWYKVVTDNVDDNHSIDSGSSYDLAIVGNYIVNAKEAEASSQDVLYVADTADLNGSFSSSATTQDVKAYFPDGSSKTITVEKVDLKTKGTTEDVKSDNKFVAGDGSSSNSVGINMLFTYSTRSNGNYELKQLDSTTNKAGFEKISTATNVDANQKIDGYSIADDAVIYVAYGNVASTYAKDKVKVLSGKTVNGWKLAYGTSVQYASKKSNGIEYIQTAVVLATTTYTGAGSDYLYAYMTGKSYNDTKGEDDVTAYPVWNGTDNTELYYDGKNGTSKTEGDVLIYSLDGDYITIEPATDVKIMNVALTGVQKKSEGDVAFTGYDLRNDTSMTTVISKTYSMNEDCVYIAINDDKEEGMAGGSLDQISLAEEHLSSAGAKDGYYLNAFIVLDSNNEITAIIYDADNNHLDGDLVVPA